MDCYKSTRKKVSIYQQVCPATRRGQRGVFDMSVLHIYGGGKVHLPHKRISPLTRALEEGAAIGLPKSSLEDTYFEVPWMRLIMSEVDIPPVRGATCVIRASNLAAM